MSPRPKPLEIPNITDPRFRMLRLELRHAHAAIERAYLLAGDGCLKYDLAMLRNLSGHLQSRIGSFEDFGCHNLIFPDIDHR
jgi:hypothetical protein